MFTWLSNLFEHTSNEELTVRIEFLERQLQECKAERDSLKIETKDLNRQLEKLRQKNNGETDGVVTIGPTDKLLITEDSQKRILEGLFYSRKPGRVRDIANALGLNVSDARVHLDTLNKNGLISFRSGSEANNYCITPNGRKAIMEKMRKQ